MRLAKTLMIQGTASTVGKSTLVTGLCRLFAQEGLRVAPFKAQNMALNSFVTADGGEIGRAQAVQAEAAGIEPAVEMNPILLKPEGNSRSQVVMLGRPLRRMEAQEYYRHRTGFREVVQRSLEALRQRFDLVLIEGAGSPVELNLAQYDLVNMAVAHLADAPVLLVGDIDRGGIFASLLGTLQLFKPEERARVKGLIINKFRGDLALWRDGERLLARMADMPVLGTVPYYTDIAIAEEDSVSLERGTSLLQRPQKRTRAVDIVVIRYPYLSNFDEFDALAAEPQVRLSLVGSPEELPERPDLIILPGSKNTLSDLGWLWRSGLALQIRHHAAQGAALLGICGGYQMLGERVCDPEGVESAPGTVEPGLNLLPVETGFVSLEEKVTQQSRARILTRRGLFAALDDSELQAYQIHAGRTRAPENPLFGLVQGETDGWISADGWKAGCYLHGLFENEAFRKAVIQALWKRRYTQDEPQPDTAFSRQQEYDKLAALLRQHLDLKLLYRILEGREG
ncbi:adenosylcobyric acid synthase (glutamine-hydrolysing) [Thermosporothrix hazakensis]|jgi:adenosylcobyric acid synthase|uniref:Cobyric acid synthase n=1 Tax=Thermosporothrix hazakensis TaxID=644383 RepID=A0A326U663_THEHA|nr:cobyric acid synthase [Thermosporothrix hazakensis]PZW27458.1 adenosylcobyric acid synthase (glutamine-hydrolysing) [Thermosporothrix hazakensis]GCE45624.1 cobyric acid synthase CobQ [Thermosporothrix hazakensis]